MDIHNVEDGLECSDISACGATNRDMLATALTKLSEFYEHASPLLTPNGGAGNAPPFYRRIASALLSVYPGLSIDFTSSPNAMRIAVAAVSNSSTVSTAFVPNISESSGIILT